jgi:hypothetical protein
LGAKGQSLLSSAVIGHVFVQILTKLVVRVLQLED